jgi:hypothetical protein
MDKQMNSVKFYEYKATPNEKHLGIITILVNDIIFLRYKVMAGKTGGHFPNPPSYKITENGVDTYIPAFIIESNMLKEEVDACIKSNVKRILEAPVATSTQTQYPHTFNAAPRPVVDEDIPF